MTMNAKIHAYLNSLNEASMGNRTMKLLSVEEAKEHLKHNRVVITINYRVTDGPHYWFFANSYLYGYKTPQMHLGRFVPISTYMPIRVAPRPGLESDVIKTIDQYAEVFSNETSIHLKTTDELVEVLMKYPELCVGLK